MEKWQRKKSEIALDHKYFKVIKDIVKLPDGKQIEWLYWDSNDSAMVLGMTIENKLVMIRQYRYLVGDNVIEFPSGGANDDETLDSAAKREFEEETGYVAKKLKKLGKFYETYGQLNRKIHLYYSLDVIKSGRKLSSEDVAENIKVELVDLEEAVQMARSNEIVAMGSALAIMLLKDVVDNNK